LKHTFLQDLSCYEDRQTVHSSNEAEDTDDKEKTFFVPFKKAPRKDKKKEESLSSVVQMFQKVVDNDTTKDLLTFLKEENERAHEHELRLMQMFMSNSSSQQNRDSFTPANAPPAMWSPGGNNSFDRSETTSTQHMFCGYTPASFQQGLGRPQACEAFYQEAQQLHFATSEGPSYRKL